MESEFSRLTRSMQGKLVKNTSSKEFNFRDPERKFKYLVPTSKMGLKIEKLDASVNKSGSNIPFAFTENMFISKALAAGIDKELMVPEDMRYSGTIDPKTNLDNKLVKDSDLLIVSVVDRVQDDEIVNMIHTSSAAANPRVAQTNGENFRENQLMENSIFSHSSSAGNLTLARTPRINNIKSGNLTPNKRAKNPEIFKKSPNFQNSRKSHG